jgi:hypothetical protein
MRVRVAFAAVVFALPGAGLTLPGARQVQEADARALLERAERFAADERFDDARALYRKLAEKYAGTAAGAVGERRSQPSAFLGAKDLVRHGPSSNRVDVVLMGDGYTFEHLRAFDRLADDVPRLFERQKTFREYWSYLNFARADLVSAEAGVDGFGRTYDTALGGRVLGTIAGHVGIDRTKVGAMLSEIPENDDLAIVFVRLGILGTGGRGVAVVGGTDAKTVIHEWGHAFAGLSDEYDAQQVRHPGTVRSGINISDTDDPAKVPWAHWLAAKVPTVGVYQGAGGRVRGAWKPTSAECVMDHAEFFCPVCQEAVVLRIHSIVDPIDASDPPSPPPGVREPLVVRETPLELTVRPMKPASHELVVRWWLIPEASLPETQGGIRDSQSGAREPQGGSREKEGTHVAERPAKEPKVDRRRRGPLPVLPGKPHATTRPDGDGVHTLRLRASDLEPGRYKVVCRVRDDARIPGEKWPWVLKDELDLLESERAWWVRVPEKR